MNICLYLPYFLTSLGEIWSIRSTLIVVEQSWVAWRSVQCKPCITSGHDWNFSSTSYTCSPVWIKFITVVSTILIVCLWILWKLA